MAVEKTVNYSCHNHFVMNCLTCTCMAISMIRFYPTFRSYPSLRSYPRFFKEMKSLADKSSHVDAMYLDSSHAEESVLHGALIRELK